MANGLDTEGAGRRGRGLGVGAVRVRGGSRSRKLLRARCSAILCPTALLSKVGGTPTPRSALSCAQYATD